MPKKKKKHDYTYSQYVALIESIDRAKQTMKVDQACVGHGITRQFYHYARQMVLRGKPMSEIEAGFKNIV
jgi:hypothetical protein